MSIIKNEIPILEFDTDTSALIMPTHENSNIKLPKKCVFAFLKNSIDEYAIIHRCEIVAVFESVTKNYPVYVTNYKGEDICLCQAPVGSAPAAQIMDWLIGYGVEKIISTGTCGALEDFPENMFLVPVKALRDEGTSYHYMAPSRYIDVNPKALCAIEKTLKEHGLNYTEVTTWTTDGFFRETQEKVLYRKNEGCSVVEMECSALAACAQMRNVVWGQILFTADTLANIDEYDMRDWGRDSFEHALELCFDTLVNL